ncbi:MAG: hypothetical protein ACI4KM_04070 [Oscillospiraceae bacterium]
MKYFLAAATVCACAAVLLNPAITAQFVGQAIGCCVEVIIPSLFAFTILSVYLQSSGLYRIALKPLTAPLSHILGIDGELCAVFVLSMTGGFPVGARLIHNLRAQGRLSAENAARMMCFCYASGPSFIIGIAGIGVFSSAAIGGVIFAACVMSSVIIAVIICRRGGKITLRHAQCEYDISGRCFIESVSGAARVMFTVCAMICGFAVVSALLEISGISGLAERFFGLFMGENGSAVLPSVLEISRISAIKPSISALPLCAGLLSFGGVCVVMQVSAIYGEGFPWGRFILWRIPAALMTAVFSLPAVLLEQPAAAVSSDFAAAEPFSVNAVLSVCTAAMSAILLLGNKKEKA